MEIFDVKETANYLNCSISSVRKLVRENKIPFFRIGTKLSFKKKTIDDWICNQENSNNFV